LTETLKQLAGGGMKNLLGRMTRNRVTGAFTGAIVTAIIQSSSVTTVLIVGFIAAGLMTLSQAIGVIMGANIGSTVMAQIIAFDVTSWALPMIFVGFFAREFLRRENIRQSGTLLLGLGLVFLGMGAMSDATRPLRTYEPFLDLLAAMDNAPLGILVGAGFTAVVQSSAATTGIAIAFASQGMITLEAGIAIAFGANIGTCATAMLAAIGKPAAAKQAAWAHLLFNVIGVLLWVFFIDPFAAAVRTISPDSVPREIANAHTIFNVVNTLLLLPFTKQLAGLVRRIRPDEPEPERVMPRFIDDGLLKTPAIALAAAHREIGHIGQRELILLEGVSEIEAATAPGDLVRTTRLALDLERIQGALASYLTRIGHQTLSDKEADQLADLLSVADYLESITEVIHRSLLPVMRDAAEAGVLDTFGAGRALEPLADGVRAEFRRTLMAVGDWDTKQAELVIDEKELVAEAGHEARVELRRLLLEGGEGMTEAYRLASRASEHLLRVYYLSKRIAKRIVQSRERIAA
jgi:phosphate:Na+ symporter